MLFPVFVSNEPVTICDYFHNPSQETEYQNVQSEEHSDQEPESCDPVKHEEESNETSCDPEEEDQPLMNANNYQFC